MRLRDFLLGYFDGIEFFFHKLYVGKSRGFNERPYITIVLFDAYTEGENL